MTCSVECKEEFSENIPSGAVFRERFLRTEHLSAKSVFICTDLMTLYVDQRPEFCCLKIHGTKSYVSIPTDFVKPVKVVQELIEF